MKSFTEKELKKTYPNYKKDLCYRVASSYDDIDAETFITDEQNEAKEEAKQYDYHVYIFTKKLMRDCLDAKYLLKVLTDDIEQLEGVDSDWLYDILSNSAKQEFCSWVTNWFSNAVGQSYLAEECIGELVEE